MTEKCGDAAHHTTSRRGAKPGSPFPAEPHGCRAVHPVVHGVAQVPALTRAAALGTNAKYSHKPEFIDPDTGEITGGKPRHDPMASRVQRFAWQATARSILPKSRTAKCLRLRASKQDISVWKSKEHGTASYAGLQTCGSVWSCPVCAAKIAERRRAEIIASMAAHKGQGGLVSMLTMTTPHQRQDNLGDLLAKQAKALHRFWSDRGTKAIFEAMGVLGQIRALEVTHGRKSPQNNGWHPHYHVLVFHDVAGDLHGWEESLYLRWAECCKRAGLGEPSRAHGLKLHDGSKAAAYASKWGLEDEMTKGHTKKALHGETPFDFLRAFLADAGDKQAAALFREFAETFKGKRQLHWSRGLKARFAVEEATDEQLANKIEDRAVLLGQITLEQWRSVLAVEGRGHLLQLATVGGWDAVEYYLGSLKPVSKEASGSACPNQLSNAWFTRKRSLATDPNFWS